MLVDSELSCALIDIDGTILPKDKGIFDLGVSLADHGLMSPHGVTEMLAARQSYKDKQLSYEGYATAALVALAKGLTGYNVEAVQAHAAQELLAASATFYPYTARLLELTRNTHVSYFVTANADFYAAVFADHFQTTGYRSTELGVQDGRYDGTITRRMTTSADKSFAAQELLMKHPGRHSIALGDSIGDYSMLEAAEIAVTVDGDEHLLAKRQPHWIITTPAKIETDLFPLLTRR